MQHVMRRVFFDIETDDLLEKLTKVHSLVLRDLDDPAAPILSCTDSAPGYASIAHGLRVLTAADRVYAHNGIRFDLPALKKVYPGFGLTGELFDTFTIASMRWAHIKDTDYALVRAGRLPGNLIGSHALKAWGIRLGVFKTDYDGGWEKWSPVMQSYCEQDTLVGEALVNHIRKHGVSMQAVETEHELAHYLAQQERNGWPFDVHAAVQLQGVLAAKREIIAGELRSVFGSWVVSLGEVIPKRANKKKGIVAGVPYTKTKTVEFNPASRDHIANRLTTLYGWKPSVFTEGGKPQVDEDTLKGLTYPPVPKLLEYLILDKRLSALVEGKGAWMGYMTDAQAEGGRLTGMAHIHGRVKQNHCITHRASHANPNMAQVPKVGNPYGAECRSLFTVPPGWEQLGADAKGLELRCLAHYMAKYDDGAYAKVVVDGDPHSITQAALAEWVGTDRKGRDTSKTFIYAWLYGAGDEKIGSILAPGKSKAEQARIGKKAKAAFLKTLPALSYLVTAVQAAAKQHGYLHLIDGRKAYIRSDHAALNTLLQGTGAVLCKRWIVQFNRGLMFAFNTPSGGGWPYEWAAMGWIHDEVQLAVRPANKEQAAVIVVDSMRAMTSHFNFRCPLDGEAKFGRNWKETH